VKPGRSLSTFLQYQLFFLPIIVVYSVFTMYPLLKTWLLSFTNFDGYNPNYKFIGIKNYVAIFYDEAILSALSFTLLYTVLSVVLTTVVAIPLAIVLNMNTYTKNLQRSVFFFPSVMSGLLIGYVWGYIFSPLESGVLNTFLTSVLGLEPVSWLSDPTLSRLSSVIVHVWAIAGWHAVLYLAFMQSIPKDYYEAASIDGATALQRVRFITIPLLRNAMAVSVMLILTGSLKVYEIPFALTNGGGPGYTNYTITQVTILRGISELQMGKAAAMSIVFFLMVMAFTFLQFHTMQKNGED